MGSYSGNGDKAVVHDWAPPPRRDDDRSFYKPPAPRKTFDDAKREDKPKLPVGQKSPKRQITCLTQVGILTSLDTTGSMQQNPGEVWNRLPLVAKESAHAMNLPEDEVSLAFATHGDGYTDDDLTASSFATAGPAVDAAMTGLSLESRGGANGVESYDIVLAYLERFLVLGQRCKRVDIFLVGDEGMPLLIDPHYHRIYVGGNQTHRRTSEVVAELRKRGARIHHIMMTDTQTNRNDHALICRSWEEALGGRAGIWKLSDARRIGDLMLLILGWEHGRLKQAKLAFEERQRSHDLRRFAEENIPLVYASFEEGVRHFPANATDIEVGPMPLD